ncbi:MAG: alpha/beta hydrolase [Pseudomonadota bacterium]|nr:alpha/beta hydrolase [Pseudomonadota bacterium]
MTPLVLLPGMMCDARLFAPQIEAFSGERCVHLAPLTARDRVEALAADVLANAPPRFALAGLSMGGIVAMEVLRQAPERVERIALIATNPRAEAQEIQDRREPQIARVLKGELEAVMNEAMLANYPAATDRAGWGADHPLRLLCLDMAKRVGAQAFERQSRALQTRPDQEETLGRAKLPALILCGDGDRLCPIERHQLMHSLIAGSELVVLKGAGHILTLERPNETNAALSRWLEPS